MKFDKQSLLWLSLIFLVGVFIRLPQTSYGLPAARFPDSAKTIDVAKSLSDQWRRGSFAMDPKTYQYPTLYTNVVGVGLLFFGSEHFSEQIGRVVTTLASALASLVVFFLCSRLRKNRCGLVAASFVSFGFLFVEQGRHPTADAVQMFLFALSLLPLFFVLDPPPGAFLLSGFVSGLAVGTKYTAVLFYVPILMMVFWFMRQNKALVIQTFFRWTGGAMVGFLVATPAFLTRHHEFIARFLTELQIQKSGDLSLVEPTLWRYLFSASASGQDRPYAESLSGTLGMAFVIVSLLGLVYAFWQGGRKKDPRITALAMSSVSGLLYFSFLSRILAVRFLLPVAVMLTVTSAVFIEDLAEAVRRHWPGRSLASPTIAVFAMTAVVLQPNLQLTLGYLRALTSIDSRMQAAEWILANLPPGTKILNFMHGPALPSQRYDLVHLQLPEYRLEMESEQQRALVLDDLRKNKIECVIWNDFYLHDLTSPQRTGVIADYFRGWAEFHDGLEQRDDRPNEVRFEGSISPTIEIFCRTGARWTPT